MSTSRPAPSRSSSLRRRLAGSPFLWSRCSAASASPLPTGRRSQPRPPGSTAATWTIADTAPGVTVYFPVAVPGALFHLGDGHAVQGDGEIVGTGVEISMDVQFTVSVVKDTNIVWPRTENDDYIMAIGNARPLDEALQAATTELVRWLAHDYGLTPAPPRSCSARPSNTTSPTSSTPPTRSSPSSTSAGCRLGRRLRRQQSSSPCSSRRPRDFTVPPVRIHEETCSPTHGRSRMLPAPAC